MAELTDKVESIMDHAFVSLTTTMHKEDAISCLLYTSDAADERVDLGGRRIIKKKKTMDAECDEWATK